MFAPPPWGRDPRYDFRSLFGHHSRHRSTYPRSSSLPPIPDYYHSHRGHDYPKGHKQTRFSNLDTPSSPGFSSSEWDDPYTFDTDDDLDKHCLPSFPSLRKRHSGPFSHGSPDVKSVDIKLPSATADELKHDEFLILPPLVHLHISIRLPYARTVELRASVVASMTFADMYKQIVRTYAGDGVGMNDVTARVEQRGRMKEPSPSTTLEELVYRGGMYRDGRSEMKVEILVGDDMKRERVSVRFGGRMPNGGVADVETVREREEKRFRVAHV